MELDEEAEPAALQDDGSALASEADQVEPISSAFREIVVAADLLADDVDRLDEVG